MPNTLTILYDGDCGFCQAARRLLESIDHTQVCAFLPLQDPDVPTRYPALTSDAIRTTMHMVNDAGQVFTGAAGYREIGWRISKRSVLGLSLGVFSVVSFVPGVLWLAEQVYAWIAKRRYQWATLITTCDDASTCER